MDEITVDRAAEILDCTRQWIYELLEEEVLAGEKVRNRWLIKKESVLLYRAEQDRVKRARGEA